MSAFVSPHSFPRAQCWRDVEELYKDPVEFVVYPYLPKGVVSSLYASGGTGKTFYMMSVAMRLAVGRPAMRAEVGPPQKVLMISAEDPMKIVVDRMRRIKATYNFNDRELKLLDQNFQYPDLIHNDTALVAYLVDETGRAVPTPTEFQLRVIATMEETRPDLLILDPLSDIFDDNENDRTRVSAFMRETGRLADRFQCSILIIGHPAKTSDSEYSGSTGWNSKVRSRLWMEIEEGAIKITHKKHQFTAAGEELLIQFVDGVPVEVGGQIEVDAFAETDIRNRIAKMVYMRTTARSYLTQTGNNSLTKAMKNQSLARGEEFDEELYYTVCGEMLEDGSIKTVTADGKDGAPLLKVSNNFVEVFVSGVQL